MRGDDDFPSDWKYIPIRRLALFMEESLYRGLKWVVFEPNDEPLWAQIRLNVGAFMRNLYRQGAFQGKSPQEAYFVKCDSETTTQNDRNLGIVNIWVGFAPLKPAEFVILLPAADGRSDRGLGGNAMADKNTQFPVNSHRYDPYKSFKFQVWWDGRCVAGVSRVSALKQSTEPVTHREGNDTSTVRVTPGAWKFEPITLERGVTHDEQFEYWAKLCWRWAEKDPTTAMASIRKDIQIKLLNEEGQVAKAYKVYNCWVSEYQALPELDANGNAVAIENMVLQNEGWERDTDVPEPQGDLCSTLSRSDLSE